jgi:hypothetical protein
VRWSELDGRISCDELAGAWRRRDTGIGQQFSGAFGCMRGAWRGERERRGTVEAAAEVFENILNRIGRGALSRPLQLVRGRPAWQVGAARRPSLSSLAPVGGRSGLVQRGAVSVDVMNGQLPIVAGLEMGRAERVATSLSRLRRPVSSLEVPRRASCLINFFSSVRSCY